MSLIYYNEELFIWLGDMPVMIQCVRYFTATEYTGRKFKFIFIFFPLLLKVWRTDDNCAKP